MNEIRKLLILIRVKLLQFRYWVKRIFWVLSQPHFLAVYVGLASTIFLIFADGTWFAFTRPKDASLFFTAGGLVGGALAIVVTLNTLLLQNTLEKLPARIYQKFTNHNGLNFIYFLLAAITVALFYLGIAYIDLQGHERGNLLRIALCLLIWALVLIFIYLRIVVRNIDPSRQISNLASSIKRKFDDTEKIIASYTGIVATHTDQDVVTEAAVRKQLTPRIADILTDLSDMASLYSRLYQRGDKQLALACLRTISATATYIYDQRKANAIALPTEYIFSAKSELSDISLKIDEIFLPIWKNAVINGDADTIREILLGYQSMVYSSVDVSHKNYLHENPLISYTFGGLKTLIELGMESKNEDAMFHSTDVIKQIALHIYAKSENDRLAAAHFDKCYSLLNAMYTLASVTRMSSVMKMCLENSLYIMAGAILTDNPDRRIRENVSKQFSETLIIANSKINSRALIAGDEIMIQEQIIRNVFGFLPSSPRKKDIVQLTQRTQLLLDALLGAMSKSKFVLNITFERFYVLTGQSLVDLLANRSKLLSEKDMEQIENALSTLVEIHQACVKNYDYEKRADGDSEQYSEQLAIVGIDAAQVKDIRHATNIVDSLMDVAEWLLPQAASISNIELLATNAARNAGMIAAVAHKNRQYELSRHYKERIQKLEEIWLRTIFPGGFKPDANYSPSPNHLRYMFNELIGGGGRSGFPAYFETVEDKALSYVSSDQFKTFDGYIWRDKTPPQELE